MEKRLFTALLLSFIVLYGWSYFVIGPQDKRQVSTIAQTTDLEEPRKTQTTVIKDVVNNSTVKSVQESIVHGQKIAPPSLKSPDAKLVQAETEYLSAEFSNLGGNLSRVTTKEHHHTLPINSILNISGYENVEFNMDELARNFVSYSYADEHFNITKRYRLSDDGQMIHAEVELTNKSEMSKLINMDIDSYQIDLSRLDKNNARDKMLLEYSVSYNGKIDRKKNLSKFKEKENRSVNDTINWTGFRDQYFCAIVKPDFESKQYYMRMVDDLHANIGFSTGEIRVEPGSKKVLSLDIYYGPQDKKLLKSYGSGFEDIINYSVGGFFDWMAFKQTDAIARLMMVLLDFIHRIVRNWGISIILFAFCIYGITYPLTQKTMNSMKKLQEHQPEMNKIREKYKNNPEKMQKETMEYYKKHKINPLGGCLPMLLQMPIFISLYQLLWRAYIFKGANFLWIKDLSEPDRLFTLPFTLPYFGNELNILPIAYGIAMFFQQKMQSKNTVITDPTQAQTQKMMGKIFPVMLGVIFYKFASGLTLYFTTYFMLTAAAQWRASKVKS